VPSRYFFFLRILQESGSCHVFPPKSTDLTLLTVHIGIQMQPFGSKSNAWEWERRLKSNHSRMQDHEGVGVTIQLFFFLGLIAFQSICICHAQISSQAVVILNRSIDGFQPFLSDSTALAKSATMLLFRCLGYIRLRGVMGLTKGHQRLPVVTKGSKPAMGVDGESRAFSSRLHPLASQEEKHTRRRHFLQSHRLPFHLTDQLGCSVGPAFYQSLRLAREKPGTFPVEASGVSFERPLRVFERLSLSVLSWSVLVRTLSRLAAPGEPWLVCCCCCKLQTALCIGHRPLSPTSTIQEPSPIPIPSLLRISRISFMPL